MNAIIRTVLFIAGFLCSAVAASAQSGCSPLIQFGAVLTAGQWNSCFVAKQDSLGFQPVNKAGDTMLGRLTMTPSTTLAAGLSIPPGVAPTSPSDGNMWTTTAGLFVRINGSTIGPLAATSGSVVCGSLPALTGDITSSAGSCATTLASVISPGSAGSSVQIPVLTWDAKGRLTVVTTAAISTGATQWTSSGPDIYFSGGNVGVGGITGPLGQISMGNPTPETVLRTYTSTDQGMINFYTAQNFPTPSAFNRSLDIVSASGAGSAKSIIRFLNQQSTGGAPTEAARIDQLGQFGIGTTAATAQLHTTGTVRFASLGTNSAGTSLNGIANVDSSGNLLAKPGYLTSIVYAADYSVAPGGHPFCTNDALSNDEVSIQAAINAASAPGSRVQLPGAFCYLNAGLTLTAPIQFVGVGAGVGPGIPYQGQSSVLLAGFASGDVISATGYYAFTFSDFQVASAVGARTGGAGIRLNGVLVGNQLATFNGAVSGTTLTITGISGSVDIGYVIQGAGVAPNTWITAFGSGTGGNGTYTLNNSASISVESMTAWQAVNNEGTIINNVTFDQQFYGIHAYLTGGPQIINTNHYNPQNRGILCEGQIGKESSCGLIFNNKFTDGGQVSTAFIDLHVGYTDILANKFIGGQIAVYGNYDTFPAGNPRFIGNLMENQKLKGIYLTNGNGIAASMIQVQNNEFSTFSATMTSEIEITASSTWCDNAQVSGNTIRSQLTGGSGAFITVDGCSNGQITNNVINMFSSNLVGIGTGSHIASPFTVEANTFAGTTSAPLFSISCATSIFYKVPGLPFSSLPSCAAPGSEIYVTDGKPNNIGLNDYNVVGGSFGTLAVRVNAAAWVAGGLH